jgi:hypothetical protein
MMPHEELFKRLHDAANIKALIGTTEDLHLDCKIWPPSENDAQRVLAKALCGFANADGGVVVIGMEAKPGPAKDDPDTVQQARPVTNALTVKSRIENLVGHLVEPGLAGVQVELVFEPPGSACGFVLVDVPPTEGLPCRSRKDWKFYLRVSAGTFPMEYFQIADMFGKRRRPLLKLYLEEGHVEPRSGISNREIVFGIENCGRGVAKFPCVRFRRGLFAVDPFGIDGNHGFGLPQLPSDPALIIFGGGSDHVIYPGTVLKIGKLEQAARISEWQPVGGKQVAQQFEEFRLTVELAADDFPSTLDTSIISPRDLTY